MDELGSMPRLLVLLGVMVAAAVAEAWIPFRSRARGWQARHRTNLALTAMFLFMTLVLTAAVLGLAVQMEQQKLGVFAMLGVSRPLALVLGVVLLDFFGYAVHVLMHKAPWLWRVHQVHHGDSMVDVTTTFRQHPFETMLRFAFTAVPALACGVPAASVATYRLLSGINAVFEHANIRVAPALDRGLRWLVVTPYMHKVHHSRAQAQTDSNYGNIFSVFDRLLGSYTPTTKAFDVTYGLESRPRA